MTKTLSDKLRELGIGQSMDIEKKRYNTLCSTVWRLRYMEDLNFTVDREVDKLVVTRTA